MQFLKQALNKFFLMKMWLKAVWLNILLYKIVIVSFVFRISFFHKSLYFIEYAD